MAIRLQNMIRHGGGEDDGENFRPIDIKDESRTMGESIQYYCCRSEGWRRIFTSGMLYVSIIFIIWTFVMPLVFGALEDDEREEAGLDELDYLGWLYFCCVTLTTTGYGDISPITTGGRVFLFFWSMTGLAVTGLVMTRIYVGWLDGAPERMKRRNLSFRLFMACHNHIPPCRPICRWMWKRAAFCIGMVWIIGFFMVSASIWYSIEPFETFGEALYFTFVSVATIGYGDFFPVTQEGRGFYVLFGFLGTTSVAWFIAVASDFAVHFHKVRRAKRLLARGEITNLSYPIPGLDMGTVKQILASKKTTMRQEILMEQLGHLVQFAEECHQWRQNPSGMDRPGLKNED